MPGRHSRSSRSFRSRRNRSHRRSHSNRRGRRGGASTKRTERSGVIIQGGIVKGALYKLKIHKGGAMYMVKLCK